FQGGHGCLMWKEIKEVMHYWFDPWQLPKAEGLTWDNPGYLSKGMVLIWLEFFLACLTRVIPPKDQFLHVPAGPTTIHPSESQEAHREQVERDGSLVYVLIFENEVTKCHQAGGMTYNQQAIDFANYVTFDSSHTGGACVPPLQWMSLPIPSPNIPTLVFFGPELAHLTSLAELLPAVAKNCVLTIVKVTNAYQEHLPAAMS
ncbi:hypothetical protein FRC11_009067, partial [Ceratobasidium sp. 423]